MKKKTILIISLVFLAVVLLSYLATALLLRQKPTLPSKATESHGPTCPVNNGSCIWSSDDSATSFNVKVVDQTSGITVLEKTTSDKKVGFTPVAGHTYKCIVVPINSCGNGPESTNTVTCKLITGTPPSDTTPTETPEISLTPTSILTPTPTEEITSSPTPTTELTETPTPTPTQTSTPTQEITTITKNTEEPPTIPASGTPAHWIFIMVPLIILLMGLIF